MNMYIRAAILALLLLSLTGICAAADQTSVNIQTFEISMKNYHLHYREAAPDEEYGGMTGVRLAYKNQNSETGEYWRIMYETTTQNDKYNGEYMDGTPCLTTTGNKINTTELIFANPIEGSSNAYAYLGLGFHNWDRNILGSGGYLEKYSWNYIPIGYRNEFRVSSKWDGAFDISFRYMFHGKMTAFMDPASPMRFNLGNKTGFKLELPYTYHMSDSCSLVLNPYYEYWGIRQSNVMQGYVEPASHNNQFGIDVGLVFKF